MKKLVGFLVIAAVAYAWYSNNTNKNKQADQLRKEVAELRKEKEALEKKNSLPPQTANQNLVSSGNIVTAKSAPVVSAKLKDLQNQFNTETTKLIALQRRKDQLSSAVTDPGQASSMQEAQEEIREKNELIQNLQTQLTSNQADEKWVDHSGEQAKQNENLTKAETVADFNSRFHAQQELIKNIQDSIKQNKITATADSMTAANAQVVQLNQQKTVLENMRRERDQINVNTAAANVQIHQQMGVAKNNIRANEDGIRAQILSLKNEIKSLQAQSSGATRTTAQLKDQMNHVDQQISSEKIVVDRLQKLIEAESTR